MYADYGFYRGVFGGECEEPKKAERYLRRATAFLKAFIFDDAVASSNENVKYACCEIAELYLNEDVTANISSESNDGYSVTYKSVDVNTQAAEIVQSYLGPTGLLYRGEKE